jgi:hypothetical protein
MAARFLKDSLAAVSGRRLQKPRMKSSGVRVLSCSAFRGSDRFTAALSIRQRQVPALPDELHDFKFLRSERGVLWSHGYQVYSTIYFVFEGQTKICPAYFAFVNGQKIGRWGR